MTLHELAERYCHLVDGSPGYADQLAWCCARLDAYLGRAARVADLSESMLNDWLDSVRDRLSPVTRRQRRNIILRLWKHAARHGICAAKPDTDEVVRIKLRQRPPQAWSIDQVRQLLAVASQLTGTYDRRWPKSLFWRSWILAAWDVGWRSCDAFALEIRQLSAKLALVQRKTGRTLYARLRTQALAAIEKWLDATGRDRRYVWERWCGRGAWCRIAQRLVKRSGLPGSIGWLRASAGTACELAFPQRGYLFLGNTPAIFYGHYFDRRLCDDFPQPPELV